MLRELLTLAWQGTIRKRRSSVLAFLVLLASFSCAILSLSLTESISKTNKEYRLNTYGEWYFLMAESLEGDMGWLERQSWTEEIGNVRLCGQIENVNGGIGSVDDTYLNMGRAKLIAGHAPEESGEIAVEERVLRELGYETYELGQEISFRILTGKGMPTKYRFTLCGIYNDFSKLWQVGGTTPVCAMVTEYTARALPAMDQYYVRVREGRQQAARSELQRYILRTRGTGLEHGGVQVNAPAYPSAKENASSETLYAYLIAAVALVGVLCVYLMGLSAEVQSFAILQSIGITKLQLFLLMAFEALLLVLPAVLLGIPLGAELTKFSLRALMYPGNVKVQAAIPYGFLGKLFLLWLGAILAARLVIFLVAVRTPLTGKMGVTAQNAHRSKCLRTALVAVLLTAFGGAVLYTAIESLSPLRLRNQYGAAPDYELYAGFSMGEDQTYYDVLPISPGDAALVGEIPGVIQTEGYWGGKGSEAQKGNAALGLSFEGLEEQMVSYAMVDERYWGHVFDFGADTEAFHNGDLVFICNDELINQKLQSQEQDETIGEKEPAPGEKVRLRAYDSGGNCLAEDWTDVVTRRFSFGDISHRLIAPITSPYTVIFSEGYLKRFLSKLPEGAQWGTCYAGGSEFGYQNILVTTNLNAEDLATETALRTFCVERGMRLDNSGHRVKLPLVQSATQELILLYACGGCIALVVLLLLGGALSLETEGEKRSYRILRTIGMSRRQVKGRVFRKALGRSLLAVGLGWGLNCGLNIWRYFHVPDKTPWERVSNFFFYLRYYQFTLVQGLALSLVCVLILLAVSVPAKRRLWREKG